MYCHTCFLLGPRIARIPIRTIEDHHIERSKIATLVSNEVLLLLSRKKNQINKSKKEMK